jgi:hypothetical protein
MDLKMVDTENTGFDLIPNDWYEAEVTKVRDKISKAGNQMVEVEFEITSGEYERRKQWVNLVPFGKGLYNCRRFVEACGTEWVKNQNLKIDDSYVGRPINIEVTTDNYLGEEKNKIKFGGFEKTEATAIMAGGAPF